MNKAQRLLELVLDEKQIIVGGGKQNGQVVIAAGGAGSGKGFALDKFVTLKNAKTFDVDALKQKLIALAKKKVKEGDDRYEEIANFNLRNKEDVAKLHQIVKERGLANKEMEAFFKSADPDRLPNVIFDKTAKSYSDIAKAVDKVIRYGYKPENIHIVWILTDYKIAFKRNVTRSRVVPSDIFLQTHKGAETTMQQVVSGKVPSNVDGEIYVILNNTKETKNWTHKTKGGLELEIFNDEGKPTPKDFTYIQVKDSGSPVIDDKNFKKKLASWIYNNAPKSAFSRDYK
jgi:dephospho-CoA kinase